MCSRAVARRYARGIDDHRRPLRHENCAQQDHDELLVTHHDSFPALSPGICSMRTPVWSAILRAKDLGNNWTLVQSLEKKIQCCCVPPLIASVMASSKASTSSGLRT